MELESINNSPCLAAIAFFHFSLHTKLIYFEILKISVLLGLIKSYCSIFLRKIKSYCFPSHFDALLFATLYK